MLTFELFEQWKSAALIQVHEEKLYAIKVGVEL